MRTMEKGLYIIPFACFTFTITIFVTEEILSIEARDFLANFYSPKHFHACSVPLGRNQLQQELSFYV